MRFDYVKFDRLRTIQQENIKGMFEAIEDYAQNSFTEGRSKSIFMTKLEEAYMWSGKALRDEQRLETE